MLILLLPVVIIAVLAFSQYESSSTHFKRYKQQNASLLKTATINHIRDVVYTGTNELCFYADSPGHILITDTNLNIIQERVLSSFPDSSLKRVIICRDKEDNTYLVRSKSRQVIIFNSSINIKDTLPLSKDLFTRVVMLDHGAYVLRGFDITVSKHDQIFIKGRLHDGIVGREKNISEKIGDAGLTTDGILLYDRQTHRVIYTYFFKGAFLIMDTSLNLISRSPTIKPSEHHEMEAGKFSAGANNQYTYLKPPKMINFQSCTYNGGLYINSWVPGAGESADVFRHFTILDRYDQADGSYTGSVYLPLYQGQQMKKFVVTPTSIVAIYDNTVVIYKRETI